MIITSISSVMSLEMSARAMFSKARLQPQSWENDYWNCRAPKTKKNFWCVVNGRMLLPIFQVFWDFVYFSLGSFSFPGFSRLYKPCSRLAHHFLLKFILFFLKFSNSCARGKKLLGAKVKVPPDKSGKSGLKHKQCRFGTSFHGVKSRLFQRQNFAKTS